MRIVTVGALALLAALPLVAQSPNDPFPAPIPEKEGAITVNVRDFAALPDVGGQAARPMLLVDEPGTKRLFVNDMRGPIYSVSYDGKSVTPYIDINAPTWSVGVQSAGRERGMQSFVFHPQFGQRGAAGYGRFYTLTDTTNTKVTPDFTPGGGNRSHDMVLLEWVAKDAAAAAYDGAAPREMIRWEHPFPNHNGGQIAFNPGAKPGTPDFGLLYIGFADGGSGGDPLDNAQNLASSFGKILRIDPLGTNSRNKKYGIPPDNPFAKDGNDEHARRDLRVRRAQPAALRLGPAQRQPVPGGHRSEHRRGGQPRDVAARTLAGTTGKGASPISGAAASASTSRAPRAS